MTLHELTAPLRGGLAELRGRVRSLLMVNGTARALVFLAVALLAYFLADYLLRLPHAVRVISLCVLLGALALEIYRYLVRPLSIPLDDAMLASHVERAHPELRDRLCSSLAFTHAADDPENEDSPELMRRVVEETVGLTGSIRFGAVARSSVPTRWAMLAVASVAVLIAVSSIWPDPFGTFLRRSILLQRIDWPRRTTLMVAGMNPGIPHKVTLGRELAIRVRAAGHVPDRIAFTFWERGEGAASAETIELSPSAEDPSLFAFTLQVQTSYEFQVTGGDDDRGGIYIVEALTPPAILAIEMACEYPAYLNLAPEVLSGGDQRVPEGTAVRISVQANMELSQAWIAFGEEGEQPLEHAGDRVYVVTRNCTEDVRYSLRLRGKGGEENDPRLDAFWIRVQKDQPPLVRIHTPTVRIERVPGGIVLVGYTVRDDHRLQQIELHYRVNGGAPRKAVLDGEPDPAVRMLAAAERAPDHVLGVARLELTRIRDDRKAPLAKGSRVEFWIEARDSAEQMQRNRSDYRIELVAEPDVTGDIETRQTGLRETVERSIEHARRAAEDVVALRSVDPGESSEFRRLAGRAQAAQARVIDDAEALARRLRNVVNLYIFNRLDDRSSVDQILPYFERHLLTPTERTGVPYRGSLYRTLWSALQERAIAVGGSVGKLLEMASLADRLATDEAPRSYRVLGKVGRADAPANVEAALDEAAASQQRVADVLDQLDRLMREWQNFEGVVRFFKELRDTEQGLVNDLEGLEGSGK